MKTSGYPLSYLCASVFFGTAAFSRHLWSIFSAVSVGAVSIPHAAWPLRLRLLPRVCTFVVVDFTCIPNRLEPVSCTRRRF